MGRETVQYQGITMIGLSVDSRAMGAALLAVEEQLAKAGADAATIARYRRAIVQALLAEDDVTAGCAPSAKGGAR